jgi:hypothetical protein
MTNNTGTTKNATTALPCAAEAIYEGFTYKLDGSGRMTITTGVTDPCFAVAAQSSRDWQLNTARTMTAGDSWSFYLIGCGETVNMQSLASITYKTGDQVTLASAGSGVTNGYVTNSESGGNTVVGVYVGADGVTTGVLGQMIRVALVTPNLSDVTT